MKISEKLTDVFKQLIPIYEKAVEELPKRDWLRYLIDLDLDEGICYASFHILRKNINDEIAQISQICGYWYKIPYICEKRNEAIDCLQWRINKMKELLSHD